MDRDTQSEPCSHCRHEQVTALQVGDEDYTGNVLKSPAQKMETRSVSMLGQASSPTNQIRRSTMSLASKEVHDAAVYTKYILLGQVNLEIFGSSNDHARIPHS